MLAALPHTGLRKGKLMTKSSLSLLVFGIYVVLSVGVTVTATLMGSPTLSLVISTLMNIVVYPILNLVSMVLYYDLRIRGEGFDVEHMSAALGQRTVYPA